MSASDANSAIFVTDTAEDVNRKANKHAFSYSQTTAVIGGSISPSSTSISFVLDDHARSEQNCKDCTSEKMLNAELKNDLKQGDIAQWQSIRLQIERPSVQTRLFPLLGEAIGSL